VVGVVGGAADVPVVPGGAVTDEDGPARRVVAEVALEEAPAVEPGAAAVVEVDDSLVSALPAACEEGASGRSEVFSDPFPSPEQAPTTRARATTSTGNGRME
jgi:hypothetical protein